MFVPLLLLSAPLVVAPQDSALAPSAAPADAWPGFRGVGTGYTEDLSLPTVWSEEENLAWTAGLTGQGQSSPVIYDGRVFVTSIRGARKEHCVVACLDLQEGSLFWQRTFAASTEVELSNMVSQGAPTPAVGEEGLFVFFESGDLLALSHGGELLWRRALTEEYGAFEGNHGLGSSPILAEGTLLLLVDHAGPSYLLGMDPATGENRWKLDRDPRVSWSTPVIAPSADGAEIVISSNGTVDGVGLADGVLRWSVEDIQGNTVPSPTVLGERILVAASKGDGCRMLQRPRAGEAAQVLWTATDIRPSGFGSPAVFGDQAILVNRSGNLFAVDLETGSLEEEAKLPESCWASPLIAGGRIYFFCKDGSTLIFERGEAGLQQLASNSLESEGTVYGVAAAGGSIVIREGSRLRCLRSTTPGNADQVELEASTNQGGR